jgi:adenine/guanine/hypoxanthine permease
VILRKIIPSHYRWAEPGDLNAFFGLMLDNMSDLVIMAGLLMGVFGIPSDIVLGRMIPGTAIGVMIGDIAYTWMALRLAERTGRSDVCAMPLGLDTPSTFVFSLAIIGPVYTSGLTDGLSPHDAGMAAWHVGMAVLVLTGIAKTALSFVGKSIRRWVPRAGLLGSIAGVAMVLIAFIPSIEVFASPISGFLSLSIILVAVIGNRVLPGKLPGAFGAVVLGTTVYYLLVEFGLQDGLPLGEAAHRATLNLAWPVPTFAFLSGIPTALQYLPIALPWAVVTVVGGIDCTESAAAAGDEYNTRNILLVEGAATVLGGLAGGIIQSTPYIGHPAYKRMGGRAAYTLATAIFIGLGGMLGYLGFFVDLFPRSAVAPILIFIGLEITAQAFVESPKRHAPAVAISFIPVIAYLIMVELAQFIPDLSTIPARMVGTLDTIRTMANGFIFTAMVWATATAYITDRRYSAAAIALLVGAAFTCIGIMHSPFASGEIFWPVTLETAEAAKVWTMTSAYILAAGLVYSISRLPMEAAPPGSVPNDPAQCDSASHNQV